MLAGPPNDPLIKPPQSNQAFKMPGSMDGCNYRFSAASAALLRRVINWKKKKKNESRLQMDRITHGFFPSSVLRCVSKDSRRLSGACGRRTSRGGWTNGTTARTHSEGSIRSARLRWLELTWRNAEDDTCSGETSELRHTQPGWHLQQLAACVHKPDTLNQISIDVFLWRKERSHFLQLTWLFA